MDPFPGEVEKDRRSSRVTLEINQVYMYGQFLPPEEIKSIMLARQESHLPNGITLISRNTPRAHILFFRRQIWQGV